MRPFRILSIAGGGIRGYIPARWIAEAGVPRTDLFAGTSTGAIIAAWLALGRDPTEPPDLYRDLGPRVFRGRIRRTPGRLWRILQHGLSRSRYSNASLQECLEERFRDVRLRDVETPLVVYAYDLSRHRVLPLSSWEHGSMRIVDALMASTAAPWYLPGYVLRLPIGSPHRDLAAVDGGICANQPSAAAITVARDEFRRRLGDIECIALGTGYAIEEVPPPRAPSIGGLQWAAGWGAPQILELVMHAQQQLAHQQARTMLGPHHYHEIDVELPEPLGMDDASSEAFGALERAAESRIQYAMQILS